MARLSEQSKTVDGYCPDCRDRSALRLTRVVADSGSDDVTAEIFSGTCERAGHKLREIDATGYWRGT